jgi:hypothetical protein
MPRSNVHDNRIGTTLELRSGFCATRKRLLRKLASEVETMLSVYRRQCRAILKGDLKFERFDAAIRQWAAKALKAKDSYRRHVEKHSC